MKRRKNPNGGKDDSKSVLKRIKQMEVKSKDAKQVIPQRKIAA
jgi:hypothetical protein